MATRLAAAMKGRMMMSSTSDRTTVQARLLGTAGGIVLAVGLLAGCATSGPGAVETPTGEPTADSFSESGSNETESLEPEGNPSDEAEGDAPAVDQAPDDDRLPVTVAVVAADAFAGGVEVRSFITDYVGDGTCRYLVVGADGEAVEAEVAALPDAQSTVCPTTVVEGLAAGAYTLTVTFENDDRAGASEPIVVEVVE